MELLKKMKRVATWTAVLAFTAMVGCNEEEFAPAAEDVLEVQDEAVIDDGFDEAEDLAFSGIFATSELGGRTESDDRLQCAEVTKERDENAGTWTVTIDFGEGCTGPNGRVRKGKIVIVHDGKIWEYGSSISIELIGFSIDDIQIQGKRTITNRTTDYSSGVVHDISLENGKVVWPDETFATREVEMTRTWIRDANNPREDIVMLEGGANGMNRKGLTYEMTIVEPIIFVRNCRDKRVFIPVKGIKEIVTDRGTIVVDFGDGTCDRIVTITINGKSKEVKL